MNRYTLMATLLMITSLQACGRSNEPPSSLEVPLLTVDEGIYFAESSNYIKLQFHSVNDKATIDIGPLRFITQVPSVKPLKTADIRVDPLHQTSDPFETRVGSALWNAKAILTNKGLSIEFQMYHFAITTEHVEVEGRQYLFANGPQVITLE